MNRLALLAIAGAISQTAWASCGSAFCTVNTGAEANGLWNQAGTRIDLRYEYIRQDQLRSGTSRVSPAGEPDEHDELKTLNRNWRLAIDHNFDKHWGVSLVVPYVGRNHAHVHNPPEGSDEEPEFENWRIRELGDVQLVGRYQMAAGDTSRHAYGLRAGLKLPTGRRDVRNGNGELAERTLQPGTGTTDLILGAYYRGPLVGAVEWFAAATVDSALDTREDFKPGARLGLDVGASMPFGSALRGHLQLNVVERRRDSGAQAEPADSGGTFVYASPGLSLVVDRQWTLYAFVQAPLYQRVNGRQLTARTGGLVGASLSF